jgi:ribose 5-phosphate isomerase B
LGADHAGFELKNQVESSLSKKGFEVYDLGAYIFDKNDDYPDFAVKVARSVVVNKARGILFCGSGQGMCIAANKVKGIRAVTVGSVAEAKLTRSHNDANVLCLSGWNTSKDSSIKIVNAWLGTEFSKASRHVRRINKISRIER